MFFQSFFLQEFGSFPKPWCTEDAAKFVAKAKELNEASKSPSEELDENILEQFAKICAGDLSPMAAAIGGIGKIYPYALKL